jgi:hypothetical protein
MPIVCASRSEDVLHTWQQFIGASTALGNTMPYSFSKKWPVFSHCKLKIMQLENTAWDNVAEGQPHSDRSVCEACQILSLSHPVSLLSFSQKQAFY